MQDGRVDEFTLCCNEDLVFGIYEGCHVNCSPESVERASGAGSEESGRVVRGALGADKVDVASWTSFSDIMKITSWCSGSITILLG